MVVTGIGITIVMKYTIQIRLEIYHDIDSSQVIDLEITEIAPVDLPDYVGQDKIGYDTYEYISYASNDIESIKKLITYRTYGLFEYLVQGYIFGNHKLTDYYIKKLLSSDFQDEYPELYI